MKTLMAISLLIIFATNTGSAQTPNEPTLPTSCKDFAITVTKGIAEAEETGAVLMSTSLIDKTGNVTNDDKLMYRTYYTYKSSGCIVYLDVTAGLSYRRKSCMLVNAVASTSASCPNHNPM